MRIVRECRDSVKLESTMSWNVQPVSMLVRIAQAFDAEIQITCGMRTANAKSILGVLSLCAAAGSVITLTAEGHDARAALKAVRNLLTHAFGALEAPAAPPYAAETCSAPAY